MKNKEEGRMILYPLQNKINTLPIYFRRKLYTPIIKNERKKERKNRKIIKSSITNTFFNVL